MDNISCLTPYMLLAFALCSAILPRTHLDIHTGETDEINLIVHSLYSEPTCSRTPFKISLGTIGLDTLI
jgi:hypothetical protein